MLSAAEFRKLNPDDQLRRIRGERHSRVLAFERNSVNESKRTVWLSIASEYPYERRWGVEILDHEKHSIRAERLHSGAPLLVGHDTGDVVGVIDDFEIAPDRKLRVLARFGNSARAQEIWQDVLDGIRRNASVGYMIHDLVLERQEEDVNTYRVTDWEPYEGSLVAVPADPSVGVGRSHGEQIMPEEHSTRSQDRRDTRESERVASLYKLGEMYRNDGGADLARELIKQPGADIETFRITLLERMRTKPPRPFATAEPAENRMLYGQGARQILPKPKWFTGPDAEERAFASGMWLRGTYGNDEAMRWCRERGLEIKTMSTAVISQGGVLVPDVLSGQIIDLSDTFGAFRKNGDSWPMSSDTLTVPRSTADPDCSFVGENEEIPEGEGTWDGIELIAKKIGTIVKLPSELMESAVINIADRVAFQLARAFAKKEDLCGFTGDGTSSFGGMRGFFNLLVDGSHDAGAIDAAATHDTFPEIDETDLATVMAALPEYALEGAKWYCSGTAFGLVFGKILQGLPGNTVSDVAGAIPRGYAGFPIVTSPVLPAGAATDYSGEVMIAFGNLMMSSKFGAKREIRIQILTERYAERDQIGIKGTERFHIVNHDLGSNTVAGPMVGLVGAA